MPVAIQAGRPETPHHTPIEDAQGLAASIAMATTGLYLLQTAGLVTGGTAGLAFLISYATGWGFGMLFFIINLPFYLLALRRRGLAFTLKSLASVAAVSWCVELMPRFLAISSIDPVVAAVLFGFVGGVGVLGLYRHGSSLGGVGILAVIVQDATGFRAGHVQNIFDILVFIAALFVMDLRLVLISLIGVVILNLVVTFNHRRDWYLPQ